MIFILWAFFTSVAVLYLCWRAVRRYDADQEVLRSRLAEVDAALEETRRRLEALEAIAAEAELKASSDLGHHASGSPENVLSSPGRAPS